MLPRCGLGLHSGAGVACEGGCGLPVTPAQTGLRARFQAWRWGLDLKVAHCRLDCATWRSCRIARAAGRDWRRCPWI